MRTGIVRGVLLLAAWSGQVWAEGWTDIDGNSRIEVQMKSGSYQLTQTQSKVEVASAAFRTVVKEGNADNTIHFTTKYVSVSDCKRERGKVVTLSLDGVYQYANDFILGGGTVATAIAERLCSMLHIEGEVKRRKSL